MAFALPKVRLDVTAHLQRRFHRLPLYEAIVLKAREMHLGSATMLRGLIGFGHSSRLHCTNMLRL